MNFEHILLPQNVDFQRGPSIFFAPQSPPTLYAPKPVYHGPAPIPYLGSHLTSSRNPIVQDPPSFPGHIHNNTVKQTETRHHRLRDASVSAVRSTIRSRVATHRPQGQVPPAKTRTALTVHKQHYQPTTHSFAPTPTISRYYQQQRRRLSLRYDPNMCRSQDRADESGRRPSVSALTNKLASSLHLERPSTTGYDSSPYNRVLLSPSSDSSYSDSSSLFSERSTTTSNSGSVSFSATSSSSSSEEKKEAFFSLRQSQLPSSARLSPYNLPISRFYTRRNAIAPPSPIGAVPSAGASMIAGSEGRQASSGPVRRGTPRGESNASRYDAGHLLLPQIPLVASPIHRSFDSNPTVLRLIVPTRRSSFPVLYQLPLSSPTDKKDAEANDEMDTSLPTTPTEEEEEEDDDLDFCCRGSDEDELQEDGLEFPLHRSDPGWRAEMAKKASELSLRRGKSVQSLRLF